MSAVPLLSKMSEVLRTLNTMKVQYSDQGFISPPIEFTQGVAVIAPSTLGLAAQMVVDHYHRQMTLPSICDQLVPKAFEDLTEIEVSPGPSITVTIGTQKLIWDLRGRRAIVMRFTDYTGVQRRGVWLSDCRFASVSQISVGNAPIRLSNVEPTSREQATMWFAEVPFATLEHLDLYGLAELARSLSAGFEDAFPEFLDYVRIPAQDFTYERHMSEVVDTNPGVIRDVIQKTFMLLDERTVAEITTTRRTHHPPLRAYTFGAAHPVMFWLTEPDPDPQAMPFAIILTTSEAWLDPGAELSYDDSVLTTEPVDLNVCPECGSTDIRPIEYGLIAPDEAYYRGEYIMGGCCISSFSPARQCMTCETTFGRVAFLWFDEDDGD